MKIASVADFKNHLSEYLTAVQNGEELEIRKRNVPLARVSSRSRPGAPRPAVASRRCSPPARWTTSTSFGLATWCGTSTCDVFLDTNVVSEIFRASVLNPFE